MITKLLSLLKLLMVAVILLAATEVYPCTIIAVGKKASADGSVIVSHTDCGPDNRIRVVHGQTFKKGALAPVYWGIRISTGHLMISGMCLDIFLR